MAGCLALGWYLGGTGLLTAATAGDAVLADRVFEIRTYTSPDGKLEDLNARWRDHTSRILARHGVQNVGFWVPEESDNTLVVLLAHESREAATANWSAFRADQEWLDARAASEADGPVSLGAEGFFMYPTDYSSLR